MNPPLGRDPRYKSLDVWRGIACLMVVLDHAGVAVTLNDSMGSGVTGWAHGLIVASLRMRLGPPLFFVISGYCIAASVDSLRRKQKNAFSFLVKRVWRTYPPYWAVVFGLAVAMAALDRLGLKHLHQGPLGLALLSPGDLTLPQWVGNFTLTETWRHLFWGGEESVYTRIAWSLCYQEQFYFVCFLVVLLAPRRLYSALAGVSVAAVAARVILWDSGALHRIDGLFPVFWHEFAVGLAVYWRANVAGSKSARVGLDLGLLALIVLGCNTDLSSTAIAAGFGLAMIAFRRWDEPASRLECLAPLRACGKRCYSIYLVHLPIVSVGNMALFELGMSNFWARAFVMIPTVSAAAVGVSWLFYRYVESRFLSPPSFQRGIFSAAPRPVGGALAA